MPGDLKMKMLHRITIVKQIFMYVKTLNGIFKVSKLNKQHCNSWEQS